MKARQPEPSGSERGEVAALAQAPPLAHPPFVNQTRYVPADGCRVLPFDAHGGTSYLVEVDGGRRWQVNTETADLIRVLDGRTTLEEAARALSDAWTRPVEPADLGTEIERTLRPAGLVTLPGEDAGAVPMRGRVAPVEALTFRVTVVGAERLAPLSRLVAPLFSREGFWLALLAALTLALWSLVSVGGPLRVMPLMFTAPVLLLALASTAVHELGHAAACRRFGCGHGELGFGLYLVFPVLYMDVDEAWRLPREQRAVVDAGGVYLQVLFGLVLAGVGLIWPPFRLTAGATLALILIIVAANLNPLFRFDGYWLLSDWTGIPNLRKRSLAALGDLLRYRRFTTESAFSTRTALLLAGYALVSLAFFAWYFGAILLRLPHFLSIEYPQMLQRGWTLARAALEQGAPLRAGLALGELILPTLLLVALCMIPVRWIRGRVAPGRAAASG